MQISGDQIKVVDMPELSETFADFLNVFASDGNTVRVEFCVTRLDPPKPSNKPSAKRYPVCRLVLTKDAALSLANQLQTWAQQLQKTQTPVVQNIRKH